MSNDLTALLARVEKAEGPDRGLDARIWCAVNDWPWSPQRIPGQTDPRPTASLDAALALCERVLPGWRWFVSFGYVDSDGGPFYGLVRESGQSDAVPTPHAGSPALALLAAMLKALIAQAASPT